MATLRNFNSLASWRNAENSLQLVNLTMPLEDARQHRDRLMTLLEVRAELRPSWWRGLFGGGKAE